MCLTSSFENPSPLGRKISRHEAVWKIFNWAPRSPDRLGALSCNTKTYLQSIHLIINGDLCERQNARLTTGNRLTDVLRNPNQSFTLFLKVRNKKKVAENLNRLESILCQLHNSTQTFS